MRTSAAINPDPASGRFDRALKEFLERAGEEHGRDHNRAWRVRNACNQAVNRCGDEMDLLEQVCRAVVAEGGYRLAWVGYAESDGPACLVLDVRLPGLSGMDLQRELAAADDPIPIIFITGHGDIPMSVRAMKAGALEFLTKPFRDQDQLDAIEHALERDAAALEQRTEARELRARYDSLTPREREVMALVVQGKLNKQVAGELGTSEITVKIQRGQVMRKMEYPGRQHRLAIRRAFGPSIRGEHHLAV